MIYGYQKSHVIGSLLRATKTEITKKLIKLINSIIK